MTNLQIFVIAYAVLFLGEKLANWLTSNPYAGLPPDVLVKINDEQAPPKAA